LRIVGVASDGLEAIQKAGELQPDLILLDIGLPKVTGIVAARRIRNIAPKSKILFLSQVFDLDVAQAALSEGGHGYVVKSDADYELFAAVEAVMQGMKFVSRRLASPAFADYVDSQATVQLRGGETVASSVVPPLAKREVGRCHNVQFYSDDSLLIDGFILFLWAALKTGKSGCLYWDCVAQKDASGKAARRESRYSYRHSSGKICRIGRCRISLQFHGE
jgi:CheY-like chemotaxis protein